MTCRPEDTVAEIQGYYGALCIAERVIQELWQQQRFETDHLVTHAGHQLQVIHPGHWNHHEGPDFKAATVKIGEETITGDVELHLYPKDWKQHGHVRDPQFQDVVLHVTLFDGPSPSGKLNPGHHLVLLPYLDSDLESMLERHAMRKVAGVDPRQEPWFRAVSQNGACDADSQHQLLLAKSRLRWDLKVNFARDRLGRYGWEESCHQMMLEVLGYRRNRSVMHQIGLAQPFATAAVSGWEPEKIFETYRGQWKLQGIRPANHPFRRLQAYHQLLKTQPGWPQHLLESFRQLPLPHGFCEILSDPAAIGQLRKTSGVQQWSHTLRQGLFHRIVGGTRIHTLCCDAFLPLLAARTDQELFPQWFVWQTGDFPDIFHAAIRNLDLRDANGAVSCNGWMQGLLQLMLETGE